MTRLDHNTGSYVPYSLGEMGSFLTSRANHHREKTGDRGL